MQAPFIPVHMALLELAGVKKPVKKRPARGPRVKVVQDDREKRWLELARRGKPLYPRI